MFVISLFVSGINGTSLPKQCILLLTITAIIGVTSYVDCTIVHLNPKFPLHEPTFSLESSALLWPMVSEWVSSGHRYRVTTSVQIRASRKLRHCDIIRHNVDKYSAIVRNLIHSSSTSGPLAGANANSEEDEPLLKEVYLFVDNINCSKTLYPQFGTEQGDIDESYSIEVQANNGKAILYAVNVWGAIRALETLSQLLYVDKSTSTSSNSTSTEQDPSASSPSTAPLPSHCHQSTGVYVNVSRVQDRPRFRYRSILIDTARHFIPTKLIIKNLDAMAYNKLNILHWHLNDDQSFPFASKKFHNFSRLAGYSNYHVYRHRDIRTVVEEARLRGIQVLLEVDTPGHGQALGKVFPNLLTACGPSIRRLANKLDNTIDPSREESYHTVQVLLQELVGLFPSKLIHLGMDDISHDCWNSNGAIRRFMSAKGMRSSVQLEEYYANRLIEMVNQMERTQVVWQDPFDKGVKLPPGTIVQVWKDVRLLADYRDWSYYMAQAVKKNYTTILSACWFLSMIQYGQDWKDLYTCDPHQFEASEEDKQRLVIGGEACLWGEYVDGTNFMSRLWPRASAVAERLWSERTEQSLNDVQYRLDAQRCRMLSRGIAAQPMQTGFCPYLDWSSLSLDEDINLPDPMEADPSLEPNETDLDVNSILQDQQITASNYEYQSSKRAANGSDKAVAEKRATKESIKTRLQSPIGTFIDEECVNVTGTSLADAAAVDDRHAETTSETTHKHQEKVIKEREEETEEEEEEDKRKDQSPSNVSESMNSASSLNWNWTHDQWWPHSRQQQQHSHSGTSQSKPNSILQSILFIVAFFLLSAL